MSTVVRRLSSPNSYCSLWRLHGVSRMGHYYSTPLYRPMNKYQGREPPSWKKNGSISYTPTSFHQNSMTRGYFRHAWPSFITTGIPHHGIGLKGSTNLNHSKFKKFSSTNQQNDFDRRGSPRWKSANRNTAMYMVAVAIVVTGLSYAAVPLYRIFCQASGYGGTVIKTEASEKVEKMEPIRERELTIKYVQPPDSSLRVRKKILVPKTLF